MKKTTYILTAVLGLTALALVLAQGMMGGYGYPQGSGYGYGSGGYGMMGGYGDAAPWGGPGYGMGMGMGGYGMGGMMMGGVYLPDARPLAEDEAKARLRSFVDRFAPGAQIRDLMAFSQNYYAQIVDKDGRGLGEVLVDRYTGAVYPEPGPNMMWNRGPAGWSVPARYDLEAAKQLAENFLNGFLPGSRIMEEQAFSGYYTFDFGRDGIEGMLSINAYTGEVWVHSWHGPFLGEDE
ncbi:peptidase M4 [Deinococcota bacterium DY0809b]